MSSSIPKAIEKLHQVGIKLDIALGRRSRYSAMPMVAALNADVYVTH
jgi:hypothetical protein